MKKGDKVWFTDWRGARHAGVITNCDSKNGKPVFDISVHNEPITSHSLEMRIGIQSSPRATEGPPIESRRPLTLAHSANAPSAYELMGQSAVPLLAQWLGRNLRCNQAGWEDHGKNGCWRSRAWRNAARVRLYGSPAPRRPGGWGGGEEEKTGG